MGSYVGERSLEQLRGWRGILVTVKNGWPEQKQDGDCHWQMEVALSYAASLFLDPVGIMWEVITVRNGSYHPGKQKQTHQVEGCEWKRIWKRILDGFQVIAFIEILGNARSLNRAVSEP